MRPSSLHDFVLYGFAGAVNPTWYPLINTYRTNNHCLNDHCLIVLPTTMHTQMMFSYQSSGAPDTTSEDLNFKNFLGEHAPRLPRSNIATPHTMLLMIDFPPWQKKSWNFLWSLCNSGIFACQEPPTIRSAYGPCSTRGEEIHQDGETFNLFKRSSWQNLSWSPLALNAIGVLIKKRLWCKHSQSIATTTVHKITAGHQSISDQITKMTLQNN